MKKMSFKDFSNLSSSSHLVQWSRTILAISVKGHEWNNSVKFGGTWISSLRDVMTSFKETVNNA